MKNTMTLAVSVDGVEILSAQGPTAIHGFSCLLDHGLRAARDSEVSKHFGFDRPINAWSWSHDEIVEVAPKVYEHRISAECSIYRVEADNVSRRDDSTRRTVTVTTTHDYR